MKIKLLHVFCMLYELTLTRKIRDISNIASDKISSIRPTPVSPRPFSGVPQPQNICLAVIIEAKLYRITDNVNMLY